MVEFLIGQEQRKLELQLPQKPVGCHEACFLMNLYLWMFFFLASNKLSAQLKLFLSLGWHSKGQRAVRVPLVNTGGVLL